MPPDPDSGPNGPNRADAMNADCSASDPPGAAPERSVPDDRHRWRWPARVALLVLVVSILPVPGSGTGDGGSEAFPVLFGLDPFVASHLLGYAILAVCCLRALEAGGTAFLERSRLRVAFLERSRLRVAFSERSRLRVLAAAVFLSAGYGALVELLQVPLPWRSGGAIDAGVNAVGAFLGVAVYLAGRWRNRSR
ncbi:VanZ family protein [haloarchaeon 3A1-DGR]|nr:VanZ family protein [haloarchaeon 3A1-DGR]